ncbi:MAG: Peptidyl-prolyl cis-trans isomerase A [Cellvibrionales bacterium UBA7375]|nr:MAG: Peptidyl-prolyl cis-trans isomerase A [Cellvibrionales bacterium UBA7375]
MYKFFNYFACITALLLSSLCFSQTTAPKVSLQTNVGEIVIELNPEAAPISVENFLGYVNERFYNGVIFHRVIKDFMIQAGGFGFDMTQKPPSKPPIVNESNNGLKNLKYSVAMARTRVPDSATSQFFINHKTNAFLDGQADRPGYAVFGKVIKGMDIVDKIASTETKNLARYENVPVKTISIIKAHVILSKPAKPTTKEDIKTDPKNKPKT